MYTVQRKIGQGTVGTVYLCERQGQQFALKLSKMHMSMSREVAVLKKLNKVRDQRLGPFLYDVDDLEQPNGAIQAFYVMEYIKGVPISSYLKGRRKDQFGTILLQLLDTFDLLHQEGLVFGDVKQEHFHITANAPMIRMLDVGGVTKLGQSVKEYSNFYDRAYWQLGTRKAEPSYDLFALVMMFIAIYYPKQFKRGKHPKKQIMPYIQQHGLLKKYQIPFQKALIGNYSSAKKMKQDVEKLMKSKPFPPKKQDEKLLPQAFIITMIAGLLYSISVYFM